MKSNSLIAISAVASLLTACTGAELLFGARLGTQIALLAIENASDAYVVENDLEPDDCEMLAAKLTRKAAIEGEPYEYVCVDINEPAANNIE